MYREKYVNKTQLKNIISRGMQSVFTQNSCTILKLKSTCLLKFSHIQRLYFLYCKVD